MPIQIKDHNTIALVVDDQDLIRKSLARALRQMGIQAVIECTQGAEALKVFDQHQVELVVSDLYMGAHDGFSLLLKIRSHETRSDVPFIVVTGEGSKEDIVKCVDLGADDYILKPFQNDDFEKKVTQALSKYYTPSPLLASLRAAEKLILEGKNPQALKVIDQVLRQDPQGARANHLKGMILAKEKRYVEAIAALKVNRNINPGFYPTLATMADVYVAIGKPDLAAEAMMQELKVHPKQPDRQCALGRIYLQQGRYNEAVDHFRLALRDDGRFAKALFGMAMAQSQLENAEKSIYYLRRLRRHHPNSTQALETAVKVGKALGKEKMAEIFLREEKKSSPDRKDTYVVLAKLLMDTDRFDEALRMIQELIKIDPENREGLSLQIRLQIKLKLIDQAIQTLKQAIALKPDVGFMVKLAELYEDKGAFPEATVLLQRCLENPEAQAATIYRLARVLHRQNEHLKAFILLQMLVSKGARDQQMLKLRMEVWNKLIARRSRRQVA